MTVPLPGAPWLRYDETGALALDGVRLDDLADRHGTPLYVYARRAMQAAARAYLDAFGTQPHRLCYAVKANSSLAVLRTFAELGCGFDIVSGGELARVLAAGGRADRTLFSGVGKTRAEMRQALQAGVHCFNVESVDELQVISQVAVELQRTAPVSLRINPDVDAGTHPYISTGLKRNKFGVAHAQALQTYRQAAALPGLRVVGIDCHIGSQLTQVEPMLEALDRLLDLVEALEREGIAIAHVDVGGGLGVRYADEAPPAAGDVVRRLVERLQARGHGQRTLMMEPGRSLVANAGVMLTEVLYLKPGEERDFCIVDSAMNDLIRPALYDAWMDVQPLRRRPTGTPRRWDVVGPVCESGDWLARERSLVVEPGDRLAVLSAGAYVAAMASNYNSRPRAAEVMVDDGRAWVIRERESIEDLWRGEAAAG